MCIVSLLESVDNVCVFLGSLGCGEDAGVALEVEQVLSCDNGLQSVGNHDDRHASFALLYLLNGFLYFLFTLGI
jgi:hypothetical protein